MNGTFNQWNMQGVLNVHIHWNIIYEWNMQGVLNAHLTL